ncbi:hypothetical protein BD560DRAFT_450817 [Blakeslea trispora]|nr:hypothetical protein BD560DRAFT_450817 [Blakeslea trispora]
MTFKIDKLVHFGLQESRHFCTQQHNSEEHRQTWKLLQKSLEKKYQCFMAQLVELQSQLEMIKLDASISYESLSTDAHDSLLYRQLESRLDEHQHKLSQLVLPLVKTKLLETSEVASNQRIPAETNSNTSSISSFYESDQQQHSDWYQSPVESKHITKQPSAHHSGCTPSTLSSFINYPQSHLNHRNALDETLSFLDALASDTDDGGFRHDLSRLLKTEQDYQHAIQTVHHINLIQRVVYSSLKWARYALVLILAIIINLKKGPDMSL